jgi:predicted phosphodiesterase
LLGETRDVRDGVQFAVMGSLMERIFCIFGTFDMGACAAGLVYANSPKSVICTNHHILIISGHNPSLQISRDQLETFAKEMKMDHTVVR